MTNSPIKHSMKKILCLVLLFISLCLTSCDILFDFSNHDENTTVPSVPHEDTDQQIRENTALGIPKYTGADVLTDEQEWIISRPAYVLSFNHERNIPNWVAWHLDDNDTGNHPRPDYFNSDPALKPEWEPVAYYDYQYKKTGFERGHMCPNGDRNGNSSMQQETFYLTNIVPQAINNNHGPWKRLESQIRYNYAYKDKEVYIIAGPSTENGGESVPDYSGEFPHDGGYYESIENAHEDRQISIDVPEYLWKILIAIPKGDNDLERINYTPEIAEVYAVWMPNSDTECINANGYYKRYQEFEVDIDFIEEMTGYDFFSDLDDAVEARLESLKSI